MQEARNATKAVMAMGGHFRLVRQRPPKPGATFDDQWKRQPDGTVVPRDRDTIVQDMIIHNKFTKRGLSYLVYAFLGAHGNPGLVVPAITGDTTVNPFLNLFLMTDVPSPPRPTPYDGDARVTWDESDTANDANIPPAPTPGDGTSHYLYEGRRSCKYNGTGPDTSDPGLKFVSDAWVNAPPYGEGELIFYAKSQIDSLVKATGYVDVTGVAAWVDGTDTFTLDDGLNDPVVFEFDTDGAITEGIPGTSLRTRIYVGDAPALTVVATRIRDAINTIGDKLYISAAVDDVITTRVNLTHYAGGSIGNVAVAETVNDANFTVTGMTGGTDESMTDRAIDNFPIQSVGMSQERACGNGEASSKIGLRAVLGLAPTIQGICDEKWVHEKFDYTTPTSSEDLHEYTGVERFDTIKGGGSAAGFVQSAEDSEVVLATFTAGVALVAATDQFELDDAEWLIPDTLGFDSEHMRLILRVTNSATGANNRDYHIRQIMSPQKVRSFESITADDDDTTTPALQVQLIRSYKGENAFDGHVENEGLTEAPTNNSDPRATVVHGQKWVSADSAGPHHVGRVFDSTLNPGGTPKTIVKFRIVAPPGTNVENLPDEFVAQVLDGGGSPPGTLPDDLVPNDNNHWSTVETYTGGEAIDIYQAGQYGKEYTITTPVAGYGFRIASIRSQDDAQQVEVQELMLAEAVGAPEGFPVTLNTDRMKTSVDAGANDVFVDLPDVAATSDVQELVDSLNAAFVGREIEAVRSEYGYLWIRSTCQGDNSTLRVYNYGASGTLGFTSGGDVNRTGLTQIVRKLVMDTLTLIYRFSLWGNRPKAV
jgi:hypothetical protein